MEYRKDRSGKPLSILGYGCMRFTKKNNRIDVDKAEKEVMEAFRKGVNYFDTAYIYPGNEVALGEILRRTGIRDEINIATKLPHYLVRTRSGIDRIFNEELSRLSTDRIDYYLIHFLTDISQWEKLKDLGIGQWIEEKKKEGKIRNIGFSFHGNTEQFLSILEDHDWDFTMIQYNYLDEHAQAGRKGLARAAEKGIPVMIMEPLRGGRLVDFLPREAKKLIRENGHGYTPAELALRWLWDQPEVTCVLSGMNSPEMVEENCRIASDAKAGHLTEEDHELVDQVREAVLASMQIPCTECGYCMPCPRGVDIPGNFRSYNRMGTEGKSSARREFFQSIGLGTPPAFASQCNGCGRCESHCPQSISIREQLKVADKALRPAPYRIGLAVARKIMIRKRKERKRKED